MSAEPVGSSADTAEARALVDLARALVGVMTDELRTSELVAHHLAGHLGDGVSIALFQANHDNLVRVAAVHLDQGPGSTRSFVDHAGDRISRFDARSAVHAVVAGGEPVVLSAGAAQAGAAQAGAAQAGNLRWRLPPPELVPWADRYGIAELAMLPVRIQGRVGGVVTLTRDRGHRPYTGQEIAFAQSLIDISTVIMEAGRMLANSTTALDEVRQQAELINGVSDAIIACDETYAIVNWSRAAERMYLYEEGEALGCDLFALLGTEFTTGDGRSVSREEVFRVLHSAGSWHGALSERRADGQQIETQSSLTALTGADGQVTGLLSVNRDVTEQRQKEYLASHDPLTGLRNRRGLHDRLTMAIDRCRQEGSALGVLFFDLDRFKPINDMLGHQAGDDVLCVTATRLTGTLRKHDLVTRLGGDEFLVVIEGLDRADGAKALARRLLEAIGEPIVLAGQAVSITASVGIVVTHTPPTETETPDRLLRLADQAMYEAKQTRTGIMLSGQRPPDFAI